MSSTPRARARDAQRRDREQRLDLVGKGAVAVERLGADLLERRRGRARARCAGTARGAGPPARSTPAARTPSPAGRCAAPAPRAPARPSSRPSTPAGCARTRRSRPRRCGPICSAPSMLPAPLISRSFIAILKPDPSAWLRADRGEPFPRLVGHLALGREEEVGERALGGTPDAPAQLVHLREPEQVGAVDDEGVGVRHVEAALDDHRATAARRPRGSRTASSAARGRPRPSARARRRCGPRAAAP